MARPWVDVTAALGGGYYPAGPTVVAGAERRFFPRGGGLFLSVQGLAAASWARVPVAGGSATVPDLSLHALGGMGFATAR